MSPQDFINGEKIDIEHQIPEGEDPLSDAMDSEIESHEESFMDKRQVEGTKWPKTGGKVLVPYTIELSDFNTDERANIAAAILQFEKHTCVRYLLCIKENR